MFGKTLLQNVALAGFLSCAVNAQTYSNSTINSTASPVVDLGYALYQSRVVKSNSSTAYYNFSNIRYAAPPLGQLRFSAPLPPLGNRSAGIQDGSYGKICPQAYARWQLGANVLNASAENESEDCLFLDVIVPQSVYDAQTNGAAGGVPVMVWFHGGGYAIGSKYAQGNPVGLLDRSFEVGDGAIWVGLNYRLGAFGFLQGETIQANGTANVGFYDQRAALNWITKNIHLFGGDPNRITAYGESAGGGSILHQITAYGGVNTSVPFQNAIMQSPAYVPSPSSSAPEEIVQEFLAAANVTSIQEARELSSEELLTANKLAQAPALYGTYRFGPAPDGNFVPDVPAKLLLSGQFDHNVSVMAAHNSNEAGRYTDPTVNNDTAFNTYMGLYFPAASNDTIDYLATVLYPAIYNGSYPWTTPFKRLDVAISDFTFTCSTTYIARAYSNISYNYQFSVPPGNHTQDVPYTFYNTPISTVLNDTLAITMQSWFTTFAETGNPNRERLPEWPVYGSEARILNLNRTFVEEIVDPTQNERCAWWQQALYR